MRFQAQIGLSHEQRQAIMMDMQNAQPQFDRLQQGLGKERAMQEFPTLLAAGQFKEAKAVLDEALRLLAEGSQPR